METHIFILIRIFPPEPWYLYGGHGRKLLSRVPTYPTLADAVGKYVVGTYVLSYARKAFGTDFRDRPSVS